jgi:Fic family protein
MMRITDRKYFKEYQEKIGADLEGWFKNYQRIDEKLDLGYNTKASAVYSSNIEGNTVDVNSFMNSIIAKQDFKPKKEILEIEDLIKAYEFAQDHPLTEKNLLKAHKILSQTILIKGKRGVYRNDRMGVFDNTGLVYLAVEPQFVEENMELMLQDIQQLIKEELTVSQAFYHASLIHLKLAHIHPFWDGNGRTARLLEKWFLSAKINSRAWKLQSERYYKEHISTYYQTINLGVNYYERNYNKCLPFLEMLAKSLNQV